MKQDVHLLIETLKDTVSKVDLRIRQIGEFPIDQLNYREREDSWSVLECIEHLNRYGRFYIPEITNRLKVYHARTRTDGAKKYYFKSGLLGGYFLKSMLPKENLKKMATFQSMNPIHSQLDLSVIKEFLDQLEELSQLLNQINGNELSKIRTSISITTLIKLKLGDTFQFVINHILRHLVQVENCIKSSTLDKK